MLTPPYHFSIVASPSLPTSTSDEPETLYRGSLPAQRNLSFVKRLRLKTLVVLKKKALKDEDPLNVWATKRGVDVKWFKAEEMEEEKLGMGRNEVGEVLKIVLNPTNYPVYIADVDGISHTTLLVACLRKLQGWHMDSIIDEICRFEPDHEDLPLVSFVSSYLSPPSSSTNSDPPFVLPPPPHPPWLWPILPASRLLPPLPTSSTSTRDRSLSGPPPSLLPFPHPLSSRKHPTMRLTFPALPTPPAASSPILSPTHHQQPNPLSRTPSRRDRIPPSSPSFAPRGTGEEIGSASILVSAPTMISTGLTGMANVLIGISSEEEKDRERERTNISARDKEKEVKTSDMASNRLGRQVSFHGDHERNQTRLQAQAVPATPGVPTCSSERDRADTVGAPSTTSSSSPVKFSREPTISSSDYTGEEGSVSPGTTTDDFLDNEDEIDEDDYEDDEDEYEDDEDDEDEDEDIQPTSQYISALDLAGFG
ncbi:hypothetical protein IAR55_001643 [Kwoniella newhampshirensis]|uniref:Putative tyrosine-protein phosphatase OCA1 n=1 Tax=Kwoniella newhampshirensis TaxID=1651941 RepID=A0AAW0Z2Q3_9TREE